MPAYVVAQIDTRDDERAKAYRTIAQASVARYGGRYLARGGTVEPREGAWPASRRLVIVEFPTLDDARRWYDSPEYAEALAVAGDAFDRTLVLADGVVPA